MTASDLNTFIVEGGKTLSGTIITNSSKNGAVALIAASLLNKGITTLEDVPKIEEVYRLLEVLSSIGVTYSWNERELTLTPPETFSLETLDTVAAMRTRSILMFIGPLLHRFNSFALPQSGGCTLGERSVRAHLWALEKFGVSIETLHDSFAITHDGLSASEVVLYESSDTATINSLFAASGIAGTSVIKYASANYQVQEVCGYLQALGIDIQGIGTTTLTITGRENIDTDIPLRSGRGSC